MTQKIFCTALAVTALGAGAGAQQETVRDRIRERLASRGNTKTQKEAGPGTQDVAITFQGRARHYLLHVPTGADGAVVLAFHGGGETPQNQEEISGLDTLSDTNHFIVA